MVIDRNISGLDGWKYCIQAFGGTIEEFGKPIMGLGMGIMKKMIVYYDEFYVSVMAQPCICPLLFSSENPIFCHNAVPCPLNQICYFYCPTQRFLLPSGCPIVLSSSISLVSLALLLFVIVLVWHFRPISRWLGVLHSASLLRRRYQLVWTGVLRQFEFLRN